MQLCWSEPAHRSSLRELRIMMLHLLSRKVNVDTAAFDRKWEQLMPRQHTPQVTQVQPNATTNGPSIATVTGSQAINVVSSANRPTGFESNFVELNASQLGQLVGDVSDELAEVHAPPETTSTPKNELSLEAELSAAFASQPEPDNEDEEMSPEVPKSAKVSLAPDLSSIQAEDLNDESKDESKDSARTEDSVRSEQTLVEEIIKEDESTNKSIPDIVATSTVHPANGTPDFMTSTPKSYPDDTTEGSSAMLVTANSNLLDTQTVTSPSYHTAMASPRTTSVGSTSDDELSLFGQKKFAALLQTVAAPSFDGDDYDISSSFDSSNLEKSIEEEEEYVKYDHLLNAEATDNRKASTDKGSKSGQHSTTSDQQEELLLELATPKTINGDDK